MFAAIIILVVVFIVMSSVKNDIRENQSRIEIERKNVNDIFQNRSHVEIQRKNVNDIETFHANRAVIFE